MSEAFTAVQTLKTHKVEPRDFHTALITKFADIPYFNVGKNARGINVITGIVQVKNPFMVKDRPIILDGVRTGWKSDFPVRDEFCLIFADSYLIITPDEFTDQNAGAV